VYENAIEKMLFESESDDNFDFTDSGNDYMAESTLGTQDDSGSSESDVHSVENTGDIQQIHTQTNKHNTEVGETVVHWQEEEIDMSNFAFNKQNELLVPISGEGTPLDFFSYYLMILSFNY